LATLSAFAQIANRLFCKSCGFGSDRPLQPIPTQSFGDFSFSFSSLSPRFNLFTLGRRQRNIHAFDD
jgi:hypothetical protein